MQDLFQFINNCFEKRKEVKPESNQLEDNESYYMCNRWLSMVSLSFPAAYVSSKLSSKLPKWAIGCLLYHQVKNKKVAPQFNYVKKDKEKKIASKEEVIKKIIGHFHVSRIHAEEILNIYIVNNINIYQAFGIRMVKK
jgi:hypothetical protein